MDRKFVADFYHLQIIKECQRLRTLLEYYLSNLPLKNNGSKVLYFNGENKPNQEFCAAVINLDIGKQNLQQCADAVIRLRAEYLFQQKKYSQIHFNFTNGFRANYIDWAKGYRIKVKGNVCVMETEI